MSNLIQLYIIFTTNIITNTILVAKIGNSATTSGTPFQNWTGTMVQFEHQLPRWAMGLLFKIVHPEFQEEIEGDLLELLRWGRLCEVAANFILAKAKFAVECGRFGVPTKSG